MRDAERAIDEIHARGRLPLLVGGTMLYFRALRRGIAEMPPADPQVRAEIDAEAAQRGWPALHADLGAIDPRAAARIQPNDAQRIQRALEVFRLTGKPLSELHARRHRRDPDLEYSCRTPGSPAIERACMTASSERFHAMMRAGLLEEVRRLHARGDLHADLPAIRSVGYRQLWEHLQGERRFGLSNRARNFRNAASGAATTDLAASGRRTCSGSMLLNPAAAAHMERAIRDCCVRT